MNQVKLPADGDRPEDGLSDTDARHLHSLERKLQLVRDRVGGVVHHQYNQNGLILFGPGGMGKNHVVQMELERLHAPYRLLNTHVTPLSLFKTLEQYPDCILVLDDVEDLLSDRIARGVLKGATWPVRKDRCGNDECLVTWSAHGKTQEFVFRGGIIIITNQQLENNPALESLATRMRPLKFVVTDKEVAALMRHVAASGYRVGDQLLLGADECREVAEFVIAESARAGKRLNMRVLIHGFADRVQADDLETGLPWDDLIASSIAGQPNIVGQIEPVSLRKQRKAHELAIARKIAGLAPQARFKAWQDETDNKSRATLYRRMEELGTSDIAEL